MDARKQSRRGAGLIASGTAIVAMLVIVASQLSHSGSLSPVASSAFAAPASTDGAQFLRNVPQRAAKALALARQWRSDAVLDGVRTRRDFNYALEFSFISPRDNALFDVTDANGRLTSQAFPPVTNAGPLDGIPLRFVDLADAVDIAKLHGMPATVKEASLETSHSGGSGPALAWKIQPVTDHYPYLYTIDAAPGGAASERAVVGTPGPQPGPALAATYTPPPPIDPSRAQKPSPAAEALWQKGDGLYSRGDYRNALAVYGEAAKAGHPRAMAVIGNMYREGQGVRQNPAEALNWYKKASDLGNRSAQFSLGSMYEEGEGLPRDDVKAAELYELSARQGMPEAQFALGLSFEFGRGVRRNRAAAIFWLRQVAAQGDGRAGWYADWLSRPDTPQFKDEAALGQYTANEVAKAGRTGPSNGRARGTDPYFDHSSDYWRQRCSGGPPC